MEYSTVSPISILVVDDEKLIRWSLRERLERAGYQVVVAGSAEQTLENLHDRVSVALLDVKLPDMGGIELCHEIRHRCPHCRVIMMTAQWSPELADEALKNGAVEVLRKPFDLDDMAIVSGIGCTGRVAGYAKVDSYHTTHGRAIPFATGLKLANPKLNVVVYSGDGDLSAIGGNHLIHAARRNMDMTVICVNNFIYGMTGGQAAPTTPGTANTSTTPWGAYEPPFNLPLLLEACGACYIARWTALHVRRLTNSLTEALQKRGFSFVEAVAPCSTLYARRNRLGSGYDLMKFYHDNCQIELDRNTADLAIEYQKTIKVGRFVDGDFVLDGLFDFAGQTLKITVSRGRRYRGPATKDGRHAPFRCTFRGLRFLLPPLVEVLQEIEVSVKRLPNHQGIRAGE